MLQLDHITIGALTIEEGLAHAQRQLGVSIPPGGKHPLMGTHNHLLRLGPALFLEVIAPDPEAAPVNRPRWFGFDLPEVRERLAESPRLLTWVARTTDIDAALAALQGGLGISPGRAIEARRGDLSWRISVPDDGSMPFDGICPTLIEWHGDMHPAARMADHGCSLQRLRLTHPQADVLAGVIAPLLGDERVVFEKGDVPACRAEIQTPQGLKNLD